MEPVWSVARRKAKFLCRIDGLNILQQMEDREILRIHPSLRNSLRLFLFPLLLIPAVIVTLRLTTWESMPVFPWMFLFVLAGLFFPAYAWLRTRFQTYVVRAGSVMSRQGLISRNTHEIRIADIRVINVRQSVLRRVLGIGDVGFASAAGDEEVVIFADVRDPERVKRVVQDLMKGSQSGD